MEQMITDTAQDKQYDKDEYIQGMIRAIQTKTDYVKGEKE